MPYTNYIPYTLIFLKINSGSPLTTHQAAKSENPKGWHLFIQISGLKFIKYFEKSSPTIQMDQRPKIVYYGTQPRIQQTVNGFPNLANKQPIPFSSPAKDPRAFLPNFQPYSATPINFSTSQNKSIPRVEINTNEKAIYDSKIVTSSSPAKIQRSFQNDKSYGSYVAQPTQNIQASLAGSGRQNTGVESGNKGEKKSNTKQSGNKADDEHSLSWTKYVGMEFKIEELQKFIRTLQQQIKSKTEQIDRLEKAKLYDKNVRLQEAEIIQRRYKKQLEEDKKKYEVDITKKKQQLNQVIVRLMDYSKKSLYHEITNYITSVLNKNTELEAALLEEKERNIEISAKLAKLEGIEKQTEEVRASREANLLQMVNELSAVTNKILYRGNYTTEAASFLDVIQVQSHQLDELRTNFQSLQNQYLRTRDNTNEMLKKLQASQNENKYKFNREKQELNSMLADLGFKLTQKQSETNFLKRRVQTLERKYKQASQEYKSQINSIEGFLKTNYKYLENSCVESVIKTLQVKNHCTECLKNTQEVEALKQKLSLLTN